MRKVIAIKFKTSLKHYYFDPGDMEISSGDYLIVETSRGVEIGQARGSVTSLPREKVPADLKPIIRKATAKDIEKDKANSIRKKDTIGICKERILAHNLDMKLIDAEYTFDDTKLIFYFSSEKRVDFRELVKDLAGQFKIRIELRQIGVRDEARMLGGLGNCGRELCCKNWLQDFEPVSIKMAKVQNLSLNPNKISGCCGRLMCCLKYENDIYQELKKGLPTQGEIVNAPDGPAKVTEVNIFTGCVKVRYFENGKFSDKDDKLDTDIYEYDKSKIKRRNKGNKKGSHSDANIAQEIETALKDELIEVIKE